MHRLTISITMLILASACGQGGGQSVASSPDAVAAPRDASAGTPGKHGIAWFDGSVEEAFSAAKAAQKPIYLYWGAEWCPPCHAINATVFRSPEFIERSTLFVPVYLDGDDRDAQAAGERFGVLGYPTMIVFDADGNELTRIPGGIDLQAYANVLDLTLGNSASTRKLVERLMAGDADLAAAECTQLAYYSWGQDTLILAAHDKADAFRRMYQRCPDVLPKERSILYFGWLEARLDALEAEDPPGRLGAAERAEALAFVDDVLDEYRLVKDNVFPILFSGARITAALTEPGPARAALTERFMEAYDRLFADTALYKRERIYTLAGKIDFERIDDPGAPISDALRDEIRAVAAWADASTPDPYERQPIINAMANVLAEAGMDELGREILLAELGISKQPYYFMVDLAGIEQRAGNHELALDWLKRAWDTSTGPATRFQWGNYYLTGLLEMTPEDRQTIHDTTVALITELQGEGGFFQRPKAQLERLEAQLEAWSEDNGQRAALAEIRKSVAAACGRDTIAASREACQRFLDAV